MVALLPNGAAQLCGAVFDIASVLSDEGKARTRARRQSPVWQLDHSVDMARVPREH